MKKAFILILIFLGYQFMVSVVFTMLNVIQGVANPFELNAMQVAITSLLSGLMITGHLIFCRDVRFGRRSFLEVPMRTLTLCLPLALSAMYVLNVLNEWLNLPNWVEEATFQLGHNVWGVTAIALIAPLSEELLFRGAIEGHLLKQGRSPLFAIVVSALFFALVHGNPAQIVFAFAFGLLLGWLYYRTGSLIPSMFCHFINNGLAVILMWANPESVNEEFIIDTPVVGGLLLSSIIFAASLFYAHKHLTKTSQPMTF